MPPALLQNDIMSEITTLPTEQINDNPTLELVQRFLDAIEDHSLERPAFVGHFVSEAGCHEALRKDMLRTLQDVCCLAENDYQFLGPDGPIIVKSPNGNCLLEECLIDDAVQQVYGRNYWVVNMAHFDGDDQADITD